MVLPHQEARLIVSLDLRRYHHQVALLQVVAPHQDLVEVQDNINENIYFIYFTSNLYKLAKFK